MAAANSTYTSVAYAADAIPQDNLMTAALALALTALVFLGAIRNVTAQRVAVADGPEQDAETSLEHRSSYFAVLAALEQKRKHSPNYVMTPEERLALAAGMIDIPFGPNEMGLSSFMATKRAGLLVELADAAEAIAAPGLALPLWAAVGLKARFDAAAQSGLDQESREYCKLIKEAQRIETAFKSAGGVTGFRQLIDRNLSQTSPVVVA